MPFIDWSNAEGLFDMLVEYVADAKTEAYGDTGRERFLQQLLSQLTAAQEYQEDLPLLMDKLRSIIQSVNPEYGDDPVMEHLTACLEELERIRRESAS